MLIQLKIMEEVICRICLCNEGFTTIFSNHKISLAEKIMCCTSVNVELNDHLPSKICNTCLDRLNISYEFKLLCEKSDAKMRKINSENIKSNLICKEQKTYSNLQYNSTLDTSKSNLDSIEETNDEHNPVTEECINNKNSSEYVTKDSLLNYDFDNQIPNQFSIKALDKEDESFGTNDKKESKEQCSTCGRVMSTRFRLRMHMRTHTGERPHSCSICGRSFTLAQSLKVHIRTHSGEKPLMCAVCGRSFAQYSGLAAHSRLHTGELPYHCNICGQKFRTTGHLQYHIRKHTGEKKYECNYCKRDFIMRADLTQHIKIHTGDKRYECSSCGAKMTRRSHLVRHMLKHSKHKPNACHSHDESSPQKSDTIKHEKRKCGSRENDLSKTSTIIIDKSTIDQNSHP